MMNVDQLRTDIESLLREYPELADDEILRADTLESATDIKVVLTALFLAADDNKMLAEATSARLTELTSRRARFKRRVEFLRELILKVLLSADLRKVELAECTLSLRASQPQIVGEVDADALPDDLCIIKREPNRTKIREALLKQREVPGLSLSNSPPALAINAK